MILSPARLARKSFSHTQLLALHREIRTYLPRGRYKQFMRSWVINNVLKGPKRRRRFEETYSCTLPALINISPTERCNLACAGCYAASYSRSTEMSAAQIQQIVEEAKRLGIYFIGLLGGEPLFRRDIFAVIARNKDVAFRISTNGTIFDEEILEHLKHCGNVVVYFSLEGFEEDTDAWRGAGVFSKIIHAMAALKRERVLFGFSVLMHAENVSTVISERFLDAMQEAGCKFGLFFPYGPANDNARFDLMLGKEQIRAAFDRLTVLEDRYAMLLVKEGYCAPAGSRNLIFERGCRAGVTIHVTPEGNVEPCNGIQFHTENVFEKGLAAVFRSPFYRDIFLCAQGAGKHCISMSAPREVLQIIRDHGAVGSHSRALPTYTQYAAGFREQNELEIMREKQSAEEIP